MGKLVAIFLIVISVVLFNVWIIHITDFADKTDICRAKGGVMVEVTNNDFKCIKVEELKL